MEGWGGGQVAAEAGEVHEDVHEETHYLELGKASEASEGGGRGEGGVRHYANYSF